MNLADCPENSSSDTRQEYTHYGAFCTVNTSIVVVDQITKLRKEKNISSFSFRFDRSRRQRSEPFCNGALSVRGLDKSVCYSHSVFLKISLLLAGS